jgi:hypothetical protein
MGKTTTLESVGVQQSNKQQTDLSQSEKMSTCRIRDIFRRLLYRGLVPARDNRTSPRAPTRRSNSSPDDQTGADARI